MKGKNTRITISGDKGVGDIVDAYLTLPDQVEDLYCVFDGAVPSDKLVEVLSECMEYLVGKGNLTPDIRVHKKAVLNQLKFADFDQNKNPDTLFESVVKKAGQWWEFIVSNIGKDVITERDRSVGHEIAQRVMNHPKASVFFNTYPSRDFYYQVPFYSSIDGVPCKILPDILIVSHPLKKIFITDIKTIFKTSRQIVADHIREYQYPHQLSFYEEVLKSYINAGGLVGAENYEIVTRWLFVPKDIRPEVVFNPLIWPCTSEMKRWAEWGGTVEGSRIYMLDKPVTSNYTINGWRYALDVYKASIQNGSSTFGAFEDPNITEEIANQLYFK